MHRNLGIQIPLSLVRTQCFWVFDVSFYKNITKMMSQEKTTESLLEIYEKNKDNMNEVNHTYFINKVTKTTCFSGKAPLKVMSDSLSYLYDKLQELDKRTFISLLNCFCFQSFPRKLLNSEQKTRILVEIVDRFQGLELKDKTFCFRFLSIYIKDLSGNQKNVRIINDLIRKVQNQSVVDQYRKRSPQEFLFYLKDIVKIYGQVEGWEENKDKKIKKLTPIVDLVYKNLIDLKTRNAFLFIEALTSDILKGQGLIKQQVFKQYLQSKMKQQIKKQLKIETYLYTLQILSRLSSQNKEMVQNIYTKIKQERCLMQEFKSEKNQTQKSSQLAEQAIDDDAENEKYSSLQGYVIKDFEIININIVLNSMLNLKLIDEQLFILLDNSFISLFKKTKTRDIRFFIIHRNKILMKMMSIVRDKPKKMSMIKKEHVLFSQNIMRMIRQSQLELKQVFTLIEQCQQFPVKSRFLKRKAKELFADYEISSEQDKTVFEGIINNY